MIYFDNAATTYPKPQCVYDGISEGSKKFMFNAGRGSYSAAQETYKMIEQTKAKIASFVDASKEQVVFTSSATESLNMLINGVGLKEGDNVYVSPFEHNAVIRPLYNKKVNIILIPFDKDTWELKENELHDLMLLKKPKCVITSQISNVTGYELPYSKIFDISAKYEAINILDAAQGYAIYHINNKNINYIVFAGHKSLYGSFGIAGFLKLENDILEPSKFGGTGSDSLNPEMPIDIPTRYESGSPNSLAIYSIFLSTDFIKNADFSTFKEELSEYLIKKLSVLVNVKVYLPNNYISKGIVSFNVDGYTPDEVGTILSENYDICVRTGYHCAPYIHDFIGSKETAGTVRISLGIFNTKDDIDKLICALEEM